MRSSQRYVMVELARGLADWTRVIQKSAMFSRRNFLRMSAVSAGVASLPRLAPAQLLKMKPAEQKPCETPVPPSIALLRSMKDQAKPITNEERQQRLQRARELMTTNRIDAIFMIGGTSLVYFTGMKWWNSERLGALVIPAKGEAFFVCPAFEEDRAREQIAKGPLGANADVRTWQEDENPYERVAQGLRDRGIVSGTLGMEERTTYVFVEGVQQAAPAMKIVSATPVTAGCRMIKSAHEVELMRLANKVTLMAYAAAHAALHDGMTQKQFEELVSQAHKRLGFEGDAGVQVGEYSALPHGSLTPQVIKPGTILLMDGGCSVEGYESDISRTFVLGKPTDKMKELFDAVKRAQSAALAAARPGVQAQSVDAAARKVITDAGYGPDYAHFTHRVGHGIGMDGHEWPYLVRGDTLPLAANMTFSDEPGIYIRGEFGVRLEDDMHITENGAELFTAQSTSLEDPFQGVLDCGCEG
jgi:Xaa-Pro dipeptidase